MSRSIYDFLYVVIGSSISHAVVVLFIIYIIFENYLVKANNKNIADKLIDYLDNYNIPIQQEFKGLVNSIGVNLNLKLFGKLLPPLDKDIVKKAEEIEYANEYHNFPYYKNAIIIILSLAILFIIFLMIFPIKFNQYIDFVLSLKEIFISLAIATVLIIIYEFAFVYYFIFNYIDYHFDNFFIDKLKYSDGTSVYEYKA
jgi:hypothetical protein